MVFADFWYFTDLIRVRRRARRRCDCLVGLLGQTSESLCSIGWLGKWMSNKKLFTQKILNMWPFASRDHSHVKVEPCIWTLFFPEDTDGEREDSSKKKREKPIFCRLLCVWLYEYNMNFCNHEKRLTLSWLEAYWVTACLSAWTWVSLVHGEWIPTVCGKTFTRK